MRADTGRREITWQLPYEPGELTVKGSSGSNETATHQLKTTSAVTSLEAIADRKTFKAGAKEVVHIEIDMKDKDGNTVYNGDNEITLIIDGPAKLLGLESGDLNSHEDYKSNKRKAYRGRLLAYVQSTGKPGDVTVNLSSPGVRDQRIRISNSK